MGKFIKMEILTTGELKKGVVFTTPLVEMRRVELLSENRLQKPSTSVAILLKFPLRRAKWRAQRFSSLLIMTENEAVSGSRSPLRLRPYPSRGTHG